MEEVSCFDCPLTLAKQNNYQQKWIVPFKEEISAKVVSSLQITMTHYHLQMVFSVATLAYF